MVIYRSLVGMILLAVGLLACVSHNTTPYAGAKREGKGIDRPFPEFEPHADFRYEPAPVAVKNSTLESKETSRYSVRHLRYPSAGSNGQPGNEVTALYYRSKSPEPKPLVIVLPIWGGHPYPSTKFTRFAQVRAAGQADVLHIQGEERLLDWQGLLEAPDEEAFLAGWRESAAREHTTVKDIRRAIDWAREQPQIDPRRIALVGFSHGALVAATVAVQEPRLAATAVVMGGAHPHKIMAQCHYGRTSNIQEMAEREFGWSADEYAARLEPILRTMNPAAFPGRADPSRVLVVDAARDRCISQVDRDDLWEALGRPRRISFDSNHQRAFLSMTPLGFNWLRYAIWSFLAENLDLDS